MSTLAAAGEDPLLLWSRVRAALEPRVGTSNFSAWIDPLRPVWTADVLVLEAPDRVARDRVARHFSAAITDALAEAGHDGPVHIGVATPWPGVPLALAAPAPDHTFESFVVGESNGDAFRAAQALVTGKRCGSLFVHGPSGVGKTHLLHAVFHALEARGTPVACLPAADLVDALLAAYSRRSDEAFWRDLAPVRALLLDDVHSLAGQEEVQERLMEGLGAWVDDGRLLVLTSDRAPGDLPRVTMRVRQQLERGAVAGIVPAEPALRLAILERKASALGIGLEPALAIRIAHALGGNVRRLEGALRRLLAHAQLDGSPVDEVLAERALPELRALPVPLTIERIVEATAAAFGTPARLLRGRSRRPDLVRPRQVAMYLARRLLRRPFVELGRWFARDHTTVVHAAQVITARLGVDRALAAMVGELERRLRHDVG